MRSIALVFMVLSVGCGDSKDCGEGTYLEDGVCIAADADADADADPEADRYIPPYTPPDMNPKSGCSVVAAPSSWMLIGWVALLLNRRRQR